MKTVPEKFSFVNAVGWELVAEHIPHSKHWDITSVDTGNFVIRLSEDTILKQVNSVPCYWTNITVIEVPKLDPVLQMRFDYFQTHIEAVKENLASLEAAFNKLKQDVKESI